MNSCNELNFVIRPSELLDEAIVKDIDFNGIQESVFLIVNFEVFLAI